MRRLREGPPRATEGSVEGKGPGLTLMTPWLSWAPSILPLYDIFPPTVSAFTIRVSEDVPTFGKYLRKPPYWGTIASMRFAGDVIIYVSCK